ncbi:MAG TPA: hypothetical protein VFV27_06190 [Nevskiaceae bacterium]|nr:hypothetical protein [Nevskiaceae bacterium]
MNASTLLTVLAALALPAPLATAAACPLPLKACGWEAAPAAEALAPLERRLASLLPLPPGSDPLLLDAAVDAVLRGCDALDPAHCLLPFPSDHFTTTVPAGTPGFATGRRVNFSPLAMPRNVLGKPIDPSEWNRNDGFSPGAMLITYVPGLDLEQTYGAPRAEIGLADLRRYQSAAAARAGFGDPPMRVLELDAQGLPVAEHPVWSELDEIADLLIPGSEAGAEDVSRPTAGRAALMLRPARNFLPGRRYVAVLRELRDASGALIPAQAPFALCRDGGSSPLPPISARCAALEQRVFPALAAAGIPRDASLYLAWDFTIASTENITGRLTHLRDDAFASLANRPGVDCRQHIEPRPLPQNPAALDCRAPRFTIDRVDPEGDDGRFVIIEGSLTVPSYLAPADTSPLEDASFQQLVSALRQDYPELEPLLGEGLGIVQGGSVLPPNRLHYQPTDGFVADPALAPYGDGRPDRLAGAGEMQTRFVCEIPKAAAEGRAPPARAALYGHGLLQGRVAITYDHAGGRASLARDYNMMFCALDWFGFAQGDIPNIATALLDMSNFPVIPDASQQGFLNWMFLTRALLHPQGFAAHPAFRAATGAAAFDRREVFYNGNSQGGILPGPLLAVSPDLNRGVFGVPGMNYSTLLRRSVDFALYSIPLYTAYPDELDRDLIFGLIQMLWDRAENNGYAAYLTAAGKAVDGTQPTLDGQSNAVLLQPAFGDHQVSMWTAEAMARTMGVAVDRRQVSDDRHPDVAPYFGLRTLRYNAAGLSNQASGLVVWDDPRTVAPPVTELPPRDGPDPHGYPRNHGAAICQMDVFLRGNGRLADVLALPAERDLAPARCAERYGVARTRALPDYAGEGPLLSGGLAVVDDLDRGLLSLSEALIRGDGAAAARAVQTLQTQLAQRVVGLAAGDQASLRALLAEMAAALADGDPQAGLQRLSEGLGAIAGLDQGLLATLQMAASGARESEVITLTGLQLADWSVPAAMGIPRPYPAGTPSETTQIGDDVRSAHHGTLLYPLPGVPALAGAPVEEIAAYAFRGGSWQEIPVQVDERQPYFLANANSDFAFYSSVDQELNYVWDIENWARTQGVCRAEYDAGPDTPLRNRGLPAATRDPVPGLDHDDELVFMARDAGELPAPGSRPAEVPADAPALTVLLNDPLLPGPPRAVLLVRKPGGSRFLGRAHYVDYRRDRNADQWIDRSFFADEDPEKLGTSNTGYGSNLSGTVCADPRDPATARESSDRFPRDGLTVSTERYRWRATGRWMVRDIRIAKPALSAEGRPVYGRDLIDRWKGRAFQQSPDSVVSLVGFEDEQVNWEGNSTLLGERCGPVRCMRTVWGADSGTNVTKTETFYRDAITYRYRVRVHPIPSDGLYTSWDYNRSAMLPSAAERRRGVPGGRYYTALRPQGVAVDGINDEVGNIDGFDGTPFYFDAPDPLFNLPLGFYNWEQVSGKGDLGSLVYIFEIKGATSLGNPLVVPYYRDDACLDDGTGDDPVRRPWPGEASTDPRVVEGYAALAGKPYEQLRCEERQGAHASHGIHYFVTHDSDNAFSPVTSTEIDGQQWQFLVPTAAPRNLGEPYANVVRLPLQVQVLPSP